MDESTLIKVLRVYDTKPKNKSTNGVSSLIIKKVTGDNYIKNTSLSNVILEAPKSSEPNNVKLYGHKVKMIQIHQIHQIHQSHIFEPKNKNAVFFKRYITFYLKDGFSLQDLLDIINIKNKNYYFYLLNNKDETKEKIKFHTETGQLTFDKNQYFKEKKTTNEFNDTEIHIVFQTDTDD